MPTRTLARATLLSLIAAAFAACSSGASGGVAATEDNFPAHITEAQLPPFLRWVRFGATTPDQLTPHLDPAHWVVSDPQPITQSTDVARFVPRPLLRVTARCNAPGVAGRPPCDPSLPADDLEFYFTTYPGRAQNVLVQLQARAMNHQPLCDSVTWPTDRTATRCDAPAISSIGMNMNQPFFRAACMGDSRGELSLRFGCIQRDPTDTRPNVLTYGLGREQGAQTLSAADPLPPGRFPARPH